VNLTPLGDRVIVRAIETQEVTASGIVLPDTAQEKPQRAEVLAVGRGRIEDGELIPIDLKEGDVVVHSKYGGTEVKVAGEDLIILREADILAKLV